MSTRGDTGRGIILSNTCYNTEVEAVEADYFLFKCPTMELMEKGRKTTKALLGYHGFTEYSPLWDIKNLKELNVMGEIEEWERCGIDCLAKMFRTGSLKSFQELREEYAVPNRSFYRYLQIRHALNAQFKEEALEWSEMSLLQM